MAKGMHTGIIRSHGAVKARALRNDGTMHIVIPDGQTVEEALGEYSAHAEVEFVQPNFIYYKSAAPTNALYSSQWGLKNTGQAISGPILANSEGFIYPGLPGTVSTAGIAGKDISIEQAWDHITDCTSVIVAVLDTGVNYNQESFTHTVGGVTTSNMWNGGAAFPNHGANFVGGLTSGALFQDPMDLDGHGTHVAGIIGGLGTVRRLLESEHHGSPRSGRARLRLLIGHRHCDRLRGRPRRESHQYELRGIVG